MRRLILLRHAKSVWDTPDADHGRTLSPRGERDAGRVADRLRNLGWVPDGVRSSDAARTRQTWEHMAGRFDAEPPVEFQAFLYLAGPHEVSKVLAQTSAETETLMLIGHNPGWEDSVAYLSGEATTLKTCSAALLEAQRDSWPELAEPSSWRLVDVVRAKELRT
ncbi:MAG: histidine phosphatase family protein [Myxococcota bacterium]